MSNYDVIIRPIMTEKTVRPGANQIAFSVKQKATKGEIRRAVESIFEVKVSSVNTLRMPGKPKRSGRQMGRRSGYKKALVTLAPGENLNLFGYGTDDFGQAEETDSED